MPHEWVSVLHGAERETRMSRTSQPVFQLHLTQDAKYLIPVPIPAPQWIAGIGGFNAPTPPLFAICPDRYWIRPHSRQRDMLH